mmetsp:Transcript_31319/g.93261  ORF Transcript_31319/g.93261 Transcript_31319/m.93261 type:complete len:245 (-) Transcript_31319:91-825(-)
MHARTHVRPARPPCARADAAASPGEHAGGQRLRALPRELEHARRPGEKLRGEEREHEPEDGGDVDTSLRLEDRARGRQGPLRGVVHERPRHVRRLYLGKLREEDPAEEQHLKDTEDDLAGRERSVCEFRVHLRPCHAVGKSAANGCDADQAKDPDAGPLEQAQAAADDGVRLWRQELRVAGDFGQGDLPFLDAGAQRGHLVLRVTRQVGQVGDAVNVQLPSASGGRGCGALGLCDPLPVILGVL